jgi:hypothetical protein
VRSLWLDEALTGEEDAPTLEDEIRADVCIVGGGFSGLWTRRGNYDEAALDPFVLKPAQHGRFWAVVDGDNYAEANFELTNKLQPS